MKALLIDASTDSGTELQALFEKKGIKLVDWIISGAGWVGLWESLKPDLVCVDWVLPKRDGLHVIYKLRSMDPGAVVLFTHSFQGHAANELELAALAFGATAVLQKPWVPSRVNATLDRLLLLNSGTDRIGE